MADTVPEHSDDKGFWKGGTSGSSSNKESSGRRSGFPGTRQPKQLGVKIDLEYPEETRAEEPRD